MIVKLLTRAGLALAPMALVGVAQAQAPAPPAPPTAPKQYTGYFTLAAGYVSDAEFGYGGASGRTTVPAGFGVEGAWGARFANGIRGELGLSYGSHGDAKTIGGATSGGDGLWTFSLDANAYLDTAPNQPINFYVGAGVGIAGFHIDDGVFDQSAMSGPVVQGIVGVEFKTSDAMRIFGEGRLRQYWADGEDDLGNSYDTNATISSFNIGLRFLN